METCTHMEGNVIFWGGAEVFWGGRGFFRGVFGRWLSDITCAFSTFVTYDEILGCLVCSITYIPFCWAQILNCVDHGNELWLRAVLGDGLGGTEGPQEI